MFDRTTDYAKSVVSGVIVAGPYIRAACDRHLKDLDTAVERKLFWDVEAADRAIRFFETVLTVEVEEPDDDGNMRSFAKPFCPQPWQAFIIGSLFGWKNGNNGLRRFRRAYIEIGKGNGKSPIAAGIGHYMLAACGKLRAEVYSAATDIDQASILFRDAVAMMDRSPALCRRLTQNGLNPVWQINHPASSSFFKPISSEKKGKSGIRPFCSLVDEIHEHRDNSVIEMLRAGTKGNQEALQVEITNSGFDKKSVCGLEHDYAVNIVTGVIENDAFFAFVCSLDDDDDPFEDETCWIKANPNLGISIHYEFIREQVREARGMPSKEGIVRRLHFCQWTDAETAAISRKIWMACQKKLDIDVIRDKAIACFGGLDLSGGGDLVAYTLTWVLDNRRDQERFASKTWFWTPADTIRDREKTDRAPYTQWVKEKYLTTVPGSYVHYGYIADELIGLCGHFKPRMIGADQYGLSRLREQLSDRGVSLPIVVHPQGFNQRRVGKLEDGPEGAEDVSLWMPDSINKLETALFDKRVDIEPNPVLTMCAANAVYKSNLTGHRMFDKEKAVNRIDGMVSFAMSIGVATLRAPPPATIIKRGSLVI